MDQTIRIVKVALLVRKLLMLILLMELIRNMGMVTLITILMV